VIKDIPINRFGFLLLELENERYRIANEILYQGG
jgi:hypothetical protein